MQKSEIGVALTGAPLPATDSDGKRDNHQSVRVTLKKKCFGCNNIRNEISAVQRDLAGPIHSILQTRSRSYTRRVSLPLSPIASI